MKKLHFGKKAWIIASIVISGILLFYANDISGDFGFLMWFAPVGIILMSLNTTGNKAFSFAFAAYLIGRMSWFSYLTEVATLIPAIIFTIALSLIFALIIVLTRKIILKTNMWLAVFAFPVFFTAFEWLMITFSPDGTAASIAYSQSNFLSLIQIVSFTGILGITFMVTFIPSALAMAWHFRHERKKILPLAIVTPMLTMAVLFYGFIRIHTIPASDKTTVGLVVLDEKMHKMGNLDFQKELEHTTNYALEIQKLSMQGAKLAVIPERAINVNAANDAATIAILSDCARQNHIGIVAGYSNFKDKTAHNSALAIDADGKVIMDYNKVHLVKVLEDEFVPGKQPGLFTFGNYQLGAAICKDMDFPSYIQQYGKEKISFLCIPAWDFVVDDWLHSRMAILAGVENGFSEVRTARLGRLTISDPYGRVNAEINCSNGKANALVGQVSLNRTHTFYSKYGNWFGGLIMFTAILFLVLIFVKVPQRGRG